MLPTLHRLLGASAVAALALALTVSSASSQERQHRVRAGQSLSKVAQRYQVSVQDLAGANDLAVSASLREGQTLRIPEPGYHYVRSGETLSTIARRRDVSVRDLMAANRLREGAPLSVGQRLALPGQLQRIEAEARWGRPRSPGVVNFHRIATQERLRVRILDSRGRPRTRARADIARLFRHKRTGVIEAPHPRLLQLLVQISDHFGGRTLQILSGYRPAEGYTEESSHHVDGSAVDLRVQGVPNEVLRDYLRTLHDVGVGYYPNSTFVHLDVRDRSRYWVDRSRAGEPPDYVRGRDRERADVDEDAINRHTARASASEG
ncbi:MAG: LysM peptidoglycan-binding domain-containing protein [Myxococcales bacterium]|nr:LysM peptidoglycan-binding domain-containing protein [Myxococcales bacterium]